MAFAIPRSSNVMAHQMAAWRAAICLFASGFMLTNGLSLSSVSPGDVQARLPTSSEPTNPPERNATIRLYPGSYKALPKPVVPCSAGSPFETLALPAGACLSGDYYLSGNVAVLSPPICADGGAPHLALFKRRGCAGPRVWHDLSPRTPLPACLDSTAWPLRAGGGDGPHGEASEAAAGEGGGAPWSHWSLAFYCAHLSDAARAEGAAAHVEARPSTLVPGGPPRAGRLQVYASRAECEAGRRPAKEEALEAPVPMNLAAYIDAHRPGSANEAQPFVRVARPSFCPDGSRARLALYSEVGCASGHHHHHRGHGHGAGEASSDHGAKIVDVTDAEGLGCIDAADYPAVAFSCSGVAELPAAKIFGAGADDGAAVWWALLALAVVASFLAVAVMVKGFDGVLRMMVCPPPPSYL